MVYWMFILGGVPKLLWYGEAALEGCEAAVAAAMAHGIPAACVLTVAI